MKKGKSFILLACVFFLCVFVLFNQRKVQPDKTYTVVNNDQMFTLYSPSGRKIYSGTSVSKLFKNMHHIMNTGNKAAFTFETNIDDGRIFFDQLINYPSFVKEIEYKNTKDVQEFRITLLEYYKEEFILQIKIL